VHASVAENNTGLVDFDRADLPGAFIVRSAFRSRRRQFLRLLAGSTVAAAAPLLYAQEWPAKPIKLVVPFPPGGNTDVIARMIAPKLQSALGQPVVVENRPGAGGNLGSDAVAKSPPDGYTLLASTLSTYALNVGLYSRLPYDPQKDLAPVALTVQVPLIVVVHPSLGVKDLAGLVRLLRDNPGKYDYGSAGNGTSGHIACYLFTQMIGAKVEHIPYKGTAPVLTDMLGGRLTFTMDAPSVLAQHIRTGALVPLAIALPQRLSLLPEIPTFAEAGLKGYDAYSWNAVWAPAGTPAPLQDKLNATINAIIAEPSMREQLDKAGSPPFLGYRRDAVQQFMQAEFEKWVPIVRASGARVD